MLDFFSFLVWPEELWGSLLQNLVLNVENSMSLTYHRKAASLCCWLKIPFSRDLSFCVWLVGRDQWSTKRLHKHFWCFPILKWSKIVFGDFKKSDTVGEGIKHKKINSSFFSVNVSRDLIGSSMRSHRWGVGSRFWYPKKIPLVSKWAFFNDAGCRRSQNFEYNFSTSRIEPRTS